MELIRQMMKEKQITQRELAARCGRERKNIMRSIDGRRMAVATLSYICDALGVELCIIDGHRKHRLNNFKCVPEIEWFFSQLKDIGIEDIDRYKEEKERLIENNRRKQRMFQERIQAHYCPSCIHSELRLRRNNRVYCNKYEGYRLRKKCESYEGRNEKYLSEISNE